MGNSKSDRALRERLLRLVFIHGFGDPVHLAPDICMAIDVVHNLLGYSIFIREKVKINKTPDELPNNAFCHISFYETILAG